jgi:hypothetical protein
MKIYCLLLDAFPYNDEFEKLCQEKGLTFLTQISHSHTKPTLLSMLTGKNPLDLSSKGLGYHALEDPDNCCEWRKDRNRSLIDIFKDKNYVVHNNNRIGMFCRDILALSCEGVSINSDHTQSLENGDYYLDAIKEVERYNHVRLTESNPNSNGSFSGFAYPDQCNGWYNNEKEKIRALQESDEDIFYLHQSHHWGSTHGVGWSPPTVSKEHAISHTMEWLSNWDFDESDSLFWIFCDHGVIKPNENPKIYPNSYMSWALVKDNTANPFSIGRHLIHPTDFYATILKKLGISISDLGRSSSIDNPLDLERIYFSEDSRVWVNPMYTTSFSTLKVKDTNTEGCPNEILQATYLKHDSSLRLLNYQFEKNHLYDNQTMNGKKYKNITEDNEKVEYHDMLKELENIIW